MAETNEADVREEIAVPLLALLGYERGTENDILREFTLSYDRNFLGRKKKNDQPLRGRADYVLVVTGSGRWVLEIKAPSIQIDQDALEQAISYARHPEISGTYAAVLNGKRFIVMHNSQRSTDEPIIDLAVSTPNDLALHVQNILSPASIRRDCTPPVVDLGQPLAKGLRSSAVITGGAIRYSSFTWECDFPLPDDAKQNLDETCRRMASNRLSITGGRVWRDETSRIRSKLDWSVPHDAMLQFAQDKRLLDVEYISLGETVSDNPEKPTVFDVVGKFHVSEGETLFDIVRWDTVTAGIATSMTYRGQATGHIRDNRFAGHFQSEYESTFPTLALPLQINMYAVGEFEVVLDTR